LNIKVGYNAQYTTFKNTNNLLKSFNSTAANNLTEAYQNFNFMHGIELGLRYHFTEKLALDAGITSLFTGNNGMSRNIGGTISSDEWRISNRNFSIGFENYYSTLGFGLHFMSSNWKYLKDFPGAETKQKVINDDLLGVKINLIIQAISGKNSFALRPYVTLPLSAIDITEANKILNNSTVVTKEELMSFGLAIVFYNGPQTR
jgi:hypothetical protein